VGILLSHITNLTKSYLRPIGWLRSCKSKSSVDAAGHPIPWWPYAATEYLEKIVRTDHRVFEFGSGNSTLWWKSLSSNVISIDHDPDWNKTAGSKLIEQDETCNSQHYAILQPFFEAGLDKILIKNVARSWRAGLRTHEFKSYAAELLNYPKNHFDFIVIDGMARVLCAWIAAKVIKEDGIIIMDDTERNMYQLAYEYLAGCGFKRIDFIGIKPIVPHKSCTSIFLKKLTML